jgi:excisionase family DNA binding protein
MAKPAASGVAAAPRRPHPTASHRAHRRRLAVPSHPSAVSDAFGADPAEATLPPRLLTVSEVATVLQVSQRELRRWIAAGRLPVVRLGRVVRIRPSDLTQLIAIGLAN